MASSIIDETFFLRLYPGKDRGTIVQWIAILRKEELHTVEALSLLSTAEFDNISLPLGVKSLLRQELNALRPAVGVLEAQPSEQMLLIHPAPAATAAPLLEQIDCVVIDISSSMKARSSLDMDKTREDMSKLLFHTLVDKMISLESRHAVGLISFGHTIRPVKEVTEEYERFHDELGRLDAAEHATKLYDSIYEAANMLECHHTLHPVKDRRIFVLTDGEDNASTRAAWQVTQYLQQKGILLDAIPLAGANTALQAMCIASGGICFNAVSLEQAVGLFERDATLHIAYRETAASTPPAITNMAVFESLFSIKVEGQTDIKSATPIILSQPVLAEAMVTEKEQHAVGVVKRILKEYATLLKKMSIFADEWKVYVGADDMTQWKAIFSPRDTGSSYFGGNFLLSINFPANYPLGHPKIVFQTPIFHTNISTDGRICHDLLQSKWTPSNTIIDALVIVTHLVKNANGNDPIEAYKGQLWRDDRAVYTSEVRKHTLTHAAHDITALETKYNLV